MTHEMFSHSFHLHYTPQNLFCQGVLQRDAAPFNVDARKLAYSLQNGQSAFAYGSLT